MSLDPPTYLASLQSNIRQRPIPWDGAVRTGTLNEDQHAKIRAADKAKRPEQLRAIVEGDIDGYAGLFAGRSSVLDTAAKHANVIQYVLVLLADLLDGRCCRTTARGKVSSPCGRHRGASRAEPRKDVPLPSPLAARRFVRRLLARANLYP